MRPAEKPHLFWRDGAWWSLHDRRVTGPIYWRNIGRRRPPVPNARECISQMTTRPGR